MKHQLTWSKQPSETGLARICQSPRGRILKCNGEKVATVSPVRVGWEREWKGWDFWAGHVGFGIEWLNSHCEGPGRFVHNDIDVVCEKCKEYVVEQLKKAAQ